MKRIILIIILFYPLVLLAHEGEAHLAVDPTALPGQRGYFWEKIGEWIDVNLLTLSTRQKQEKKLKLSDERVAEMLALLEQKETANENLREAWRRYESALLDAEFMAEKIIVLDGKEIAVAEKLEKATRVHEQVLSQALELTSQENRPIVLQALNFARAQNEAIFKFMVKNYQATEADIQKHKAIIGEHMEIAQSLAFNVQDSKTRTQIKNYLDEAEKFQKAGLNEQAYDWVNKAKNVAYTYLIK